MLMFAENANAAEDKILFTVVVEDKWICILSHSKTVNLELAIHKRYWTTSGEIFANIFKSYLTDQCVR